SQDWSHLLSGAGAGFLTTVLLHPLDLIKTRMHVQEAGGRRLPYYSNVLQAFRVIVRVEGARGLYQGVGPNIFGSTVSWALYMFGYNQLKADLTRMQEARPADARLSPSAVYIVAATASGTAVSLVMHPVFTIKTRMQPADRCGSEACWSWRSRSHEGVASLYRGIGPSLLLVSHGSVQFLSYEHLKQAFRGLNAGRAPAGAAEADLSAPQLTAAATGSKVVATLVTYPYQVVRSILQQRAVVGSDVVQHATASGAVRHLWSSERLRGFYRGLVPHILRAAP
ncbi:mitochondrial carrier protein, partial [Emiliania huxleyi CCMP1516]|uniref:Mitochondrial folate transporter/carrier n=2 Tax=Emiliania huxleyi TaxID=2903 RepID=A0A0D3IUK9_EMIH1